MSLPNGLVAYGPETNCTLALCPVEWSVLTYRPSVPASAVFMALFAIALVVHLVEGLRWRTSLTSFAIPMVLGCTDEIIGYAGRLILYNNPFSFSGFLMQIICITTAPVFIAAAIYVTLARTIRHLDVGLARFNPRILLWVFIPCDIVSLVFQAAGGALSSTSTDSYQTGVNMSLFGLAFQVFMLLLFIALSLDYLVRYLRAHGTARMDTRFRVFLGGLLAAFLFVLIRCVYRIEELREGYTSELFHNEPLFYALESAMMAAAVFCLAIGQPGFGLQTSADTTEMTETTGTETTSGSDGAKERANV